MGMKVQDREFAESRQKVDAPDCHTERSFYDAFVNDLKSARALVLIQSPFIADGRLRHLEKHLRDCVSRHVRVCVFIQEPIVMRGDSASEARSRKVGMLIDLLISWGIHVSVRKSIHAKIITVDETILWEGSLNPLSHTDSSERMLRWCNREMLLKTILTHQLDSCDCCRSKGRSLKCLPEAIIARQHLELIGTAVVKRRKELGLTQRALGERSGTCQTVVSQIESGRQPMSQDMLSRVSAQLQLEIRLVPWFYLPSIDEMIDEGR
jgi:hypothetical protein